jgi:hypothetical protein
MRDLARSEARVVRVITNEQDSQWTPGHSEGVKLGGRHGT